MHYKFGAVVLCMLLGTAANAAEPGVLTTHRISAALALQIVGAAVAVCAKQGYGVTAVLIDVDGVRQAQLRGDGAGIHTLDSAYSKAYTAVTMKTDTIALVEQAKTQPPSNSLIKLPNMLLSQGGVLVKVGDEVVGALGVGGAPGGNIDTGCARDALAQFADRLK